MTGWRVVVPFKTGRDAKTRLGAAVGPGARRALADTMLVRLRDAIDASGRFKRAIVVADERPADWHGDWLADPAQGLNAAIAAGLAAAGRPALVIHADLPLIEAADLAALLDAAEAAGAAIAPDRHGTGTNAIAIADARGFVPMFGVDSFARHRAQMPMPAAIVTRAGLAVDCDTPDDLAAAGMTA